jgi:hypothetical protein
LGPVRGHAFLPAGARQVVAGDLRGLGGFGRETSSSGVTRSARAFHVGLCQRASPLANVRNGVSSTAAEMPDLAASRTDQNRRFRFKNKLMSLDATVIDLCASVFDWAQFRRTKGAVKLHLLLDHNVTTSMSFLCASYSLLTWPRPSSVSSNTFAIAPFRLLERLIRPRRFSRSIAGLIAIFGKCTIFDPMTDVDSGPLCSKASKIMKSMKQTP